METAAANLLGETLQDTDVLLNLIRLETLRNRLVREVSALNDTLRVFVCQLGARPGNSVSAVYKCASLNSLYDAPFKALAEHVAFGVHGEEDGEGEPLDIGHKTAKLLAQQRRQHGDCTLN